MSTGQGRAVNHRATTALTAILIAAAGLTACGSNKDSDAKSSGTTPPPAAASSAPAAAPSHAVSDTEAKLGIPPKPDAATKAKYIAALTAIDPDIVHGKEDKAVDRGRNECRTIHDSPKDPAKQADMADKRFTSPTHPQGFGAAKAAKIRDAVHEHLCPTF